MFNSLNKYLSDIKEDITVFGRTSFGEGGELRLSWSASGFGVKFVGSAVAVFLHPYPDYEESEGMYASLKLEIDGVGHKSAVTRDSRIVFADGLEDGEHTLRLFRASAGDEVVRVSAIQVVGAAPAILPYRPEYNFRLEILGDSITCGYGAFRGIRTGYTCFEEDATASYGFLASEYLGAELRLVSVSGLGLVKSCSGSTVTRFIDFFKRSERRPESRPHDFTSWQPDVLVINGGTNDAGSGTVSDADFEKGIKELYSFARSVYPEAHILFFYGAMGHVYRKVYEKTVGVLAQKDDRVSLKIVDTVSEEKNEVAVASHPSVIGQKRLGKELTEELDRILSDLE